VFVVTTADKVGSPFRHGVDIAHIALRLMYAVRRCAVRKEYILVKRNLDWNSAWTYCQSHFSNMNGRLVAIRSQQEQDALVSYLKSVLG